MSPSVLWPQQEGTETNGLQTHRWCPDAGCLLEVAVEKDGCKSPGDHQEHCDKHWHGSALKLLDDADVGGELGGGGTRGGGQERCERAS